MKNQIGKRLPNTIQRLIFRSKLAMRLTGNVHFGNGYLDKIILEELEQLDGGYFIEIGANNGIAQSNTKHLELFRGWRGLLVEPWPENFQRISVTRSKKTKAFHAACVSFDYELSSVGLYYSNLLTIAEGLESDKPDAKDWAKGAEFLLPEGERVKFFEAPARTLDSILVESAAPRHIDFFSLDVEGAEIEVLKGIDFENFTFGLFCIETESLDIIKTFLSDRGYEMYRQISFHDYLFRPK